jgi:hypothetical protein
MTYENEQQTEFGPTDGRTANAIGIVNLCLAAGKPNMITRLLFGRGTVAQAEKILREMSPREQPAPKPPADPWNDLRLASDAWFAGRAPRQRELQSRG